MVALLPACDSNEPKIDTTYPVISTTGLFPQPCTELERGKTHTFVVTFSDNRELGSFNFDIHHNFDHHNHSTTGEECEEEDPKDPVRPFLLVQPHTIPAGLTTYTAEVPVSIPEDVDTGDYHFRVDVTDKTGWQTIKTMSIKIK